MKRNYLIPTPDWTSKTSVLTAACRVCGLSLGELKQRIATGAAYGYGPTQVLCEIAAELLKLPEAQLERWSLDSDVETDALLRNLFQESNPLRAARRSSGLSVTAFARMLGMSRQRLHVLERATGGEALLRACARAQAHGA